MEILEIVEIMETATTSHRGKGLGIA